MKKNNKCFVRMLTFYDKILIIFILFTAIALYGILALNILNSTDDIIVVRQDGTEILKLTQKELNDDGIYDFKFDRGTGYIEVKEKKVRMLPMDKTICPQAICSETGWVSDSSKTIVCMPNRLTVSFKTDEGSEVDGITF